MAPDHLNYIERIIVNNFRSGSYMTGGDPVEATAWSDGSVKVFGQFPLVFPMTAVREKSVTIATRR